MLSTFLCTWGPWFRKIQKNFLSLTWPSETLVTHTLLDYNLHVTEIAAWLNKVCVYDLGHTFYKDLYKFIQIYPSVLCLTWFPTSSPAFLVSLIPELFWGSEISISCSWALHYAGLTLGLLFSAKVSYYLSICFPVTNFLVLGYF